MRILIADDYVDSAQSLADLVQAWGFEPIVVHDGRTALALLRESGGPTLALLDWNMPGLNGIEVCREIRKEVGHFYVYVILVTGRSGRERMLDGLRAGADDYLVKPVDGSELRARLSTAKRILELQEQLLNTQRQLREQATQDSLTGLWNRAMILDNLQRELTRSRREDQPITVLMADIDHFKQINDTYGHLAGDTVLHQVGQGLLAMIRPYDTVGRYGGEEFLVVLPGCGEDVALTLAERLRENVERQVIMDGGQLLQVTMSLGLATWDGAMTGQELLRKADEALYQAKRLGRNRVACAKTLGSAKNEKSPASARC